ncbi:MAG: aldehyde dehydrogenase [Dehalococcoidales bacterium]|nr:aldehyde dehydrogenase [Dehalococcoidales bacterium]
MANYKMWIDGKAVDAVSGKTFNSYNPATGEVIAQVPLGDKEDINRAVAAAKKALPAWKKISNRDRSQLMFRIAEAAKKNADELCHLEIDEHGMPVMMARMQGFAVANMFENIAHLGSEIRTGDVAVTEADRLAYNKREPIGVAALITPWNMPLMMVAWKMSLAIGTGNTCIVKPPSISSLGAIRLVELITELGLPPGVVNIVTGPGATTGEALASHPDVNLVAFTGSCEVGKRIMELSSQTVKRLQLELGGKNPIILLEDADVDLAVGKCVWGQHMNSGAICAAPGRYYIHKKIYDEFVEKYVDGAKKITVGDPNDEKNAMGPVVSAEHRDRIEGFIAAGVKEGAKVVLGGQRPTQPPLDKGYYVMPTVITNVRQDSVLAREEIFGPVACIMEPCSSDEEAIALANDNTFGLASSIYSRNVAKAIKYADDLEAGTVWVNDTMAVGDLPWGGFKHSGFGKEGTKYGIEEYTQLKAVSVVLKS